MSELIDNRAQRVRTLKGIIKRLHAGDAPDEVRNSLKELVCQTDYSEVMAMEQELIADGMPVEEIQGMCDLHSQVTREVLVQLAPAPVPPGHPVDTFRRENEALRESIARLQQAMNRVLETADDGDASARLLEWRQALNELQDVDKHYQRKEHLLFTCLERHGITGPSKVMWGKDDQIRELLKDLSAALRETDTTVAEWKLLAATTGRGCGGSVHEMIYKEEQILLPDLPGAVYGGRMGGDLGFLTAIRLVPGGTASKATSRSTCRRRIGPRRPAAFPFRRGASLWNNSSPSSPRFRWTSRSWMPTTGWRSFPKVRTGFSRAAAPLSDAWCRTAIRREAST